MPPRRGTARAATGCGSARGSAGGSRRPRCWFPRAPARRPRRRPTTAAPGPYAALTPPREFAPRLGAAAPAGALRAALDDPAPGYAGGAAAALAPSRRAAVDRTVADELLPRLVE